MTRIIPKGSHFWPDDANDLPADKVLEMYANGFVGAWADPDEHALLRETIKAQGGWPDGDAAANAFGLAESGAGKLCIPFVHVLSIYTGCWPGPAQQRGDCVSWGQKNANLVTMCGDVLGGKPDEVTGIIEGAPEVPEAGITNGALSTEAIYWYRGYNGDGWSCQTSARVSITKGALWPRKPYPELGIDLTKYSGGLAGKYGSQPPPSEFTTTGQKNLIRTATDLNGFEQVRDFSNNCYGINSCGGEGFSSQRDENGVSRRQGSWSHSMAVIGADDRPEVKAIYGEPLVLIQNSHGKFNSGPRRILGTTIDIPEGSFWARWSDVRNRYYVAMSGAVGWPARTLPPYKSSLG